MVVLPFMTSSLVLLRLSFIKFSSVQALKFSSSSEALSLTLGPAGILHVMSSAYLVIKVFWEVGLLSLTKIVKKYRPQNSALGYTSIDRQEWGCDFVHTYPLLTIF